MKTEQDIKIRIEEIKKGIVELVSSGLYTNDVLQENRVWLEVLNWVLEGK